MVFDLAQVAGYSQRSAYDTVFEELRKELTDALKSGPKRLLATYLQRRPPREPARRETDGFSRSAPSTATVCRVDRALARGQRPRPSMEASAATGSAVRRRGSGLSPSSCSPAHGGKSGS